MTTNSDNKVLNKIFENLNSSGFIFSVSDNHLLFGHVLKFFPGCLNCKLLSFVRFTVLFICNELCIFILYVICILDCLIVICTLWDRFFELHDFNYFHYSQYFIHLQKFRNYILIYGTEESPHMWPKRLSLLSKPESVNGHWFAVTIHWWQQL